MVNVHLYLGARQGGNRLLTMSINKDTTVRELTQMVNEEFIRESRDVNTDDFLTQNAIIIYHGKTLSPQSVVMTVAASSRHRVSFLDQGWSHFSMHYTSV